MSDGNGLRRNMPESKFEYDGNAYTVRFGLVAMAELMDHFGAATLDDLVKRLSDLGHQDLRAIAAVFRAGLAYHHPGMSDAAALRLADDIGIQELLKVVNEAFMAGLPAQKVKAEATGTRPRKPGPSTG